MDISKIRPKGPWILVKVDPPVEKMGSLYVPQGNAEERFGKTTGTIIAVGDGKRTSDKVYSKTGRKYDSIDLQPGAKIMFRGFLQEANRPGGLLDREHCLLHVDDVIGEIVET
jgi:co-chaperonin GroES (HSP10)